VSLRARVETDGRPLVPQADERRMKADVAKSPHSLKTNPRWTDAN